MIYSKKRQKQICDTKRAINPHDPEIPRLNAEAAQKARDHAFAEWSKECSDANQDCVKLFGLLKK